MKHIKLAVPDDFEGTGEFHLVDYTKDGGSASTPVTVWEPEYRDVLDHGFVGLVDFMGDDRAVLDAARVSRGGQGQRKSTDEGLIRFLMRKRHTTPFEMVTFKWHVKAPIFVFRQWHRHRTASINEYSARYSVLDNEMYLPEHEQATSQSFSTKQGRLSIESGGLSAEHYTGVLAALDQLYETAYQTYLYLLGPIEGTEDDPQYPAPPDAINQRKLWVEESAVRAAHKIVQDNIENLTPLSNDSQKTLLKAKMREYYAANELSILAEGYPGLTRELARLPLPVATYSQMYWQANLHNTLHFVGLRSAPDAQWEIRQYSDAMLEMMEPYIPWCMQAFKDYALQGVHLSSIEKELFKVFVGIVEDLGWDEESIASWLSSRGASSREIYEFWKRFGVD